MYGRNTFNDKQTKDLLDMLNLQSSLNDYTNKALKEIKPSPTITPSSQIDDKFTRRDKAMVNLNKLTGYFSVSNQMTQYLESTADLEAFNTLFPRFEKEYVSLPKIGLGALKSLWSVFKEKIRK